MKIELHFGVSQKETNKVAKFLTPEEKEKYVEEESRNLHCQQCYFEYQAAKNSKERFEAAKKLDDARYAFYLKWAKWNEKKPGHLSPIPPFNDKFPA